MGTIPKSENDITENWIRETVGLTPLPNSMSVKGNIQDGVGFLSNLCRVSFQTADGVQQNILVKLLPDDPMYRALTTSKSFDESEIQFYSIVMPKILEVAPDIKENLCKVYCGKTSKTDSNPSVDKDYRSMLVMEDLQPLGYKILNPESEQWRDNLKKVMEFLARFHCASLTLSRVSKTKICELFPFCMWVGESKLFSLMDLAKTNASRLISFLEKNNCSSELLTAYKELPEYTKQHFVRTLEEAAKHPCLIHGDAWPPNIMVTEKVETPVKIIDWQLLAYIDPGLEISVTILTCLPKAQITRANVDNLCKAYLDNCEALGGNFGRSNAEFKEFFDTWGMVYAYFWLLLSMDSYPNDVERLFMMFEFLQREYKIVQFMRSL